MLKCLVATAATSVRGRVTGRMASSVGSPFRLSPTTEGLNSSRVVLSFFPTWIRSGCSLDTYSAGLTPVSTRHDLQPDSGSARTRTDHSRERGIRASEGWREKIHRTDGTAPQGVAWSVGRNCGTVLAQASRCRR